MFAKASALFTLALAAFAVAAPQGDHVSASTDCNANDIYCCDQLHAPGSTNYNHVAGLVAGTVSGVSGQLGGQCIPIAAAIAASTSGKCQRTTACCKDYRSGSLVGLDCNSLAGQV